MRKSFLGISVLTIFCAGLIGCENNQPAPTALPTMIPPQPVGLPGQPAAVPGQIPGQLPAAVPGQIPGQFPAAVPGQVPGVPGQPVAVPAVPGGFPAAVPGAPAQPAVSAPVATGDVLVDNLNTKRFEVAPDKQPTSALLKQSLEKGKSQAYQVQLSGPPYCQTYVVSAADSVKDVNVVLDSPAGAREAADDAAGNVAVIANHCPTMPGMYKLTVSMPGDAGEFAVQVFSK